MIFFVFMIGDDEFHMRKLAHEQKSSSQSSIHDDKTNVVQDCPKQHQIEINLEDLLVDPRLHTKILNYYPNIYDQFQKSILVKGTLSTS